MKKSYYLFIRIAISILETIAAVCAVAARIVTRYGPR
jgi:hypothetical protein